MGNVPQAGYRYGVVEHRNGAVPAKRGQFAAKLRAERRAARMTQADVAASAAMDRSYYIAVEQGRKAPTIDKVFDLADALGIDAALLFTFDVDASSSDRLPGSDS